MGQTLTHGVYLPNEGERNCYNGLASNWRLLDGAIGTVAAHTTAIAGKADISHAHGNISNDGKVGTTANVPLITGTGGVVQAGSFGNQANTFCEGNDSRLSDARTPVAHTHTKSDVTDLLNSNFIPSANNSYDLGSSSYQWNNLYAKNYYYNGVAWGLDKNNTWTAWQTLENTNANALLRLRRTNIKIGDAIPSAQKEVGSIAFAGSDNINLGLIATRDESSGHTRLIFAARQRYDSKGDRANNGTTYEARINVGVDESHKYYLSPNTNGDIDLGTSTNKWKTLNGVNPGGLSLPNVRAAVADPVDTNNWNLTGSRNTYTPTEDGWFFIRVAGTGNCAINIHTGSSSNEYPTWLNSSTGGYATLVVPVEKSITLYIYISATSIEYCSFRPCIGNV